MAGWREKKRAALADIHATFDIPAVYIVANGREPVRVNPRLHQRHSLTENTMAAWGSAASLLDMTDRMVFPQSEIPLGEIREKAIVVVGPDEVYTMGPSRPTRETYITVEITQMTPEKAIAFTDTLDKTHPAYEGILT